MSLIALLDPKTLWGRRFAQPTWKLPNGINNSEANEWGSVGQAIHKTEPCMFIKAAHQSNY